jgi:glycosyltransferase involved in cell wall biosynthesis
VPTPLKLVVDAVCAEYGGNRTYVDHLLRRWHAVRPGDELHVVVPAGSTLSTHGHARHELTVTGPSVVSRPLAQTRILRRLVADVKPDAVLATAPPTTLRRVGAPLAVVVLDLRHEVLPHQFSRGRRLIRKLAYGRSFRIADGFLTISARTLDDLHTNHPGTRSVPGTVTHLGADHVLGWPTASRSGPAVAFGHHTNKNPDLVLRAWSTGLGRGDQLPPLVILGTSGAARQRLQEIIDADGLGESVTLAPFLDDEEFMQILTSASMIVFPSDFEGFGLPIVEGMLLGKPVVISPEPGSGEVAGGNAVVMRGWKPEQLADAVVEALSRTDDELKRAADWAATFTWDATVEKTGLALERLVGPRVSA